MRMRWCIAQGAYTASLQGPCSTLWKWWITIW